MHILAAVVMTGIYLYNLPVAIAFIWKKHRFSAGLGVFYGRGAMRRARRRLEKTGEQKNEKNRNARRGAVITARLVKHIKIEYFAARLLVGTGDAAATAKLCGGLIALGNVLRAAAHGGRVDIRPDFSGRVFEGEAALIILLKAGDMAREAAKYALGR